MSKAHTEALRRRWNDPAYRARQIAHNRLAAQKRRQKPNIPEGGSMSEEIARAIADRAAELAAIRSRVERAPYRYNEIHDADYLVAAQLLDGNDALIDFIEPNEDEVAVLRELVQAQHDRLTLLARLDDAKAAVQAARALLMDIRAYLETRPTRTPLIERLITAIVARTGPAVDIARLFEE